MNNAQAISARHWQDIPKTAKKGVWPCFLQFLPMATYSIGQELGCGAYSMLPLLLVSLHKSEIPPIGIVYEGKNSEGDAVAVKKSRATASVTHTLLKHEACALILVAPHKGFPRPYAWGRSQWFEYLALDLLGPSLSEMLHGGQFSVGSVLLLTIQMVRLLI
jgi:hypothetical protein